MQIQTRMRLVGSYLPTMVQGASVLYWPVWFGKLSRFGLRLQQHQGCEGSCSFLHVWLSALTFFHVGTRTHARMQSLHTLHTKRVSNNDKAFIQLAPLSRLIVREGTAMSDHLLRVEYSLRPRTLVSMDCSRFSGPASWPGDRDCVPQWYLFRSL